MSGKKLPEEMIRTAMMIDLPQFIRAQGIELKQYRTGWEYGTGSEKTTVWRDRADGHYQWMRQYDRLSGNAIQWVQAYGSRSSFVDAVCLLCDWVGGTPAAVRIAPSAPSAAVKERKEQTEFRLPPPDVSFARVTAYLCKTRRIDRDVVTAFHKAQLIYESTVYHNAVFIGRAPDGTARHANLRSTVTSNRGRAFKTNQEGSDAKYSFHWAGHGTCLFVFEAPIDLLSYISMHLDNWQVHNYLALCGTFTDALVQFAKDHPHIQTVYLCLDNDDAGRRGNARCAAALDRLGIRHQTIVPFGKDWNEDLKEARK